MSQIIEVPGMGPVEFPDGMKDSEIVAAIQRSAPTGDVSPVTMNPNIAKTKGRSTLYDTTAPGVGARFGRGLMDIGQGVKQGGLELAEKYGVVDPGTAADYTKKVQNEIASYEKDAGPGVDVARIAGNIAPGFLIPVGAGPNALARIATSALSGAAGGASQFVPEGGSRGSNALTGAALGGGGQTAIEGGRAFTPQANQVVQRAADKARAMGILPTPGGATASPTLRRVEAGLENTVGGGMVMEGRNKANLKAFDRNVLKTIGAEGDTVSRDVLGAAKAKISGKFETALGNATVAPDEKFIIDLTGILKQQQILPKKLQNDFVIDLVNDPKLLSNMDAKTYNTIRSEIGRKSVEAFRGNRSGEALLLDRLQESLDDLAQRSLTPDKQALLSQARNEWRNLKTIRKAVDPDKGGFSPAKLRNAVNQTDPSGFAYGGSSPLIPLADTAQFLRGNPDSFTASRLGGMLAPSFVGGAVGAHEAGPAGAVEGALAGLALPYLAARGYMSPITPQLLGGVGSLSALAQRATPGIAAAASR